MPSGQNNKYYFERALFIVGEQNSGKSTQLRSMFLDRRLGKNGRIPRKGKLVETYSLSNERWLYLRLTSPHEVGECIAGTAGKNFLDKTEKRMTSHRPAVVRWNFACALQPSASNNMPDLDETIEAFVNRFHPERTRIVFLSPDRRGSLLQPLHTGLVSSLTSLHSHIEVCWIDAQSRTANGVLLADFFDFT